MSAVDYTQSLGWMQSHDETQDGNIYREWWREQVREKEKVEEVWGMTSLGIFFFCQESDSDIPADWVCRNVS